MAFIFLGIHHLRGVYLRVQGAVPGNHTHGWNTADDIML